MVLRLWEDKNQDAERCQENHLYKSVKVHKHEQHNSGIIVQRYDSMVARWQFDDMTACWYEMFQTSRVNAVVILV